MSWRCPVCARLLVRSGDRSWRCASGHDFDVAREGYVNLLVTHQRRSRAPGDSAEMVRRRRRFLDAGHYTPLATAVAEQLAAHASRRGRERLRLVDAGCGEGHYSRRWPDELDAVVAAVDIAKPAVRAAARRGALPGRLEYAVASVYDLPLPDAWADGAACVFAPLDTGELHRVVRSGGAIVTATPGPRHLWQLKEQLFAVPDEHADSAPLPDPIEVQRLRYEVSLTGAGAAGDLLGMTPYVWYLDGETVERVEALVSLTTEVDFIVATYRRP